MLFPLPRFRIYTNPRMYFSILEDILLGQAKSGDKNRILEEKVKDKTDSPYAVCIPQARVGIFLVIKTLIEPGQKVIVSPYTISDVINMVICAGGIPVFADINRNTCNIDPAEIECLIDDDTGAVLITHFHGYSCEMDKISRVCKDRRVPLIEDCAQAFGTRYRSRSVGAFGEAGIFSFGMYKNVNTFFGGMVVTPNRELHARLTKEIGKFPYQETNSYLLKVLSGLASDLATYPLIFKLFTFWLFRFGHLNNIGFLKNRVAIDIDPKLKKVIPETYLRRMMPMQSKLALSQIDSLDRNSDVRINYASIYYEGLKDIEELIVAPLHKDRSHIYTYYSIQAEKRDDLVRWLMKKGCDIAISHHKNCADLPAFKEFYRNCPNARKTANSLIFLPTYPRYSEKHVRSNIEIVKKFYSNKRLK